MFNGRPFPVHVFPQIIRNAVYEAEQQTQLPSFDCCIGIGSNFACLPEPD